MEEILEKAYQETLLLMKKIYLNSLKSQDATRSSKRTECLHSEFLSILKDNELKSNKKIEYFSDKERKTTKIIVNDNKNKNEFTVDGIKKENDKIINLYLFKYLIKSINKNGYNYIENMNGQIIRIFAYPKNVNYNLIFINFFPSHELIKDNKTNKYIFKISNLQEVDTSLNSNISFLNENENKINLTELVKYINIRYDINETLTNNSFDSIKDVYNFIENNNLKDNILKFNNEQEENYKKDLKFLLNLE